VKHHRFMVWSCQAFQNLAGLVHLAGGSRRLRLAFLPDSWLRVTQARAGSECLQVLGVQALAIPHLRRFADVYLDTARLHRASFRLLASAGPSGM